MKKQRVTLTAQQWCYLILIVGFLSRMIYALYVGYNYSPHDLGQLSTADSPGYGHLAYIQYLYENRAFPHAYIGQFYHPPLFHLIGALVAALFRVRDNYAAAFEALQQLNMLFSCVGTVFAYKIVEQVCKEKRYLIVATLFLTFCPAFYILGGELNNDCLATMFQIMAVYCVMIWLETPTVRNILKIALCIDGAMLSKLSGGIIAFAIGACFLYRLIDRRTEWKKYVAQYAVFGAVCIPLGLSWVIYRRVTLGQPFNYVMRLGEAHPQYVGNLSIGERIAFPLHMELNYSRIDFRNPVFHGNIWTQMFYTMNFDENLILGMSSAVSTLIYRIQFYGSVILYFLLARTTVRTLFDRTVRMDHILLFGMNYLVLFVSFFKFAFDYPHICTMNFRYIVLTPVLLMASYGLFYDKHRENRLLNTLVSILTAVLSVTMLLLYHIWART